MESIFPDHHGGLRDIHSFHERWPLDGWNDDVIQPARDAVLSYYKVHVLRSSPSVCAQPIEPNSIYSLNQRYAEPSDVKEYMRRNNLS